MLSSLRARLVFSHLLVIVLAMGVAGLLLLSFLEAYFLRSTEDSLIAQAHLTVQSIVPSARAAAPDIVTQAPLNNAIQQQAANNLALQSSNLSVPSNTLVLNNLDLSYLSNASLQLGAQLTTRIRIINAQGVVLVDNQNQQIGADLHTDPLVAQALRGDFASRTDTGDNATLAVAAPIIVDDQHIGVAYLSQSLRDVLTVLQDLRVRLALSTIVALVIAALVGWWLSRAITRPVQQLTSAAEALATGQFDQAVTVNSHDELGRLGHTFNDMTARLNAARQMQIDFVANVSHELRTPLTSIKGTVETLRDGAVDDLSVRDRFLETIATETDRLTRLVNDLLILSRADSAALNLRRQPLDVGRLGRALIDRLAAQAAMRDLSFKIDLDPATPLAWADADRIEQVLINLLDNALKYARPHTTITLEIAPTPDRLVLARVRDLGAGIPADQLARIGQRFYRADKARSREQGGHGLGLAIAQSLIHAHGGRMWLESEEGVGTTASFTLPAM